MIKAEEPPVNGKMSVADIAYRILKSKGEPVYFRDLIGQVLSVKSIQGSDLGHQMSAVHTELNLDNRFVFLGKGMWALRELNLGAGHKEY
ncbi:MAG TPA: DNA-directed RNA polymerase subunit delta, partial [Bacillota bacterium]|nr:DNA-directed RNA polymerase subunit delta [Bacillota bacterium]